MPLDLEQFKKDRQEALLSMDKQKITAYMKKYDNPVPKRDLIFWAGVHKARTALYSLPIQARLTSKEWLSARGFDSMDDGDL